MGKYPGSIIKHFSIINPCVQPTNNTRLSGDTELSSLSLLIWIISNEFTTNKMCFNTKIIYIWASCIVQMVIQSKMIKNLYDGCKKISELRDFLMKKKIDSQANQNSFFISSFGYRNCSFITKQISFFFFFYNSNQFLLGANKIRNV